MALRHQSLDKIPKQFHSLLIQILTAAHITIVSLWKTNTTPNVSDTVLKVQNSAQCERIMVYNADSIQRFHNNWNSWLYEYPIKDS